jgi:hypothetical protein
LCCVLLRQHLVNYLLRLGSNHYPSDLRFLSNWDYRCESLVPDSPRFLIRVLLFSSLIHLELIFLYSVKQECIFLYVNIHYFHIVVETIVLFH